MRKRFRKFIRRLIVKLIIEDFQENGEIRGLLGHYEQREPVLIDRRCDDVFANVRAFRKESLLRKIEEEYGS